jgi:hypothetical protein
LTVVEFGAGDLSSPDAKAGFEIPVRRITARLAEARESARIGMRMNISVPPAARVSHANVPFVYAVAGRNRGEAHPGIAMLVAICKASREQAK